MPKAATRCFQWYDNWEVPSFLLQSGLKKKPYLTADPNAGYGELPPRIPTHFLYIKESEVNEKSLKKDLVNKALCAESSGPHCRPGCFHYRFNFFLSPRFRGRYQSKGLRLFLWNRPYSEEELYVLSRREDPRVRLGASSLPYPTSPPDKDDAPETAGPWARTNRALINF